MDCVGYFCWFTVLLVLLLLFIDVENGGDDIERIGPPDSPPVELLDILRFGEIWRDLGRLGKCGFTFSG